MTKDGLLMILTIQDLKVCHLILCSLEDSFLCYGIISYTELKKKKNNLLKKTLLIMPIDQTKFKQEGSTEKDNKQEEA